MSRTLARLGLRIRRPKHDLKHRQDQDARVRCRVVLADLKKRGSAEPSLIYLDETYVDANPGLAKGWQRCEMHLTVLAVRTSTRISLYGARDYATGTVTSHLADRAVRETFMVFLKQLLAA